MSRIALIDGDILLYTAGFASQHKVYDIFVDGEETPLHSFRYKRDMWDWVSSCDQKFIDTLVLKESSVDEPLPLAIYNMKEMIVTILKGAEASEFIIFYSGPTNFREKIATIAEYKGTRSRNKPTHYQAMKDYMIQNYFCTESVDEEADDLIGIKQIELHKKGLEPIICTKDKDLNMIPGLHYNMMDGKVFYVDKQKASYNFYYQLLVGDSIDNIKGVPGIGKATAVKILKDATSEKYMFAEVAGAYCNVYGKDYMKYLKENADLLWIRQEVGQSWNPPI